MNTNTRIALEQFLTAVQQYLDKNEDGVAVVMSTTAQSVVDHAELLKHALRTDETIL